MIWQFGDLLFMFALHKTIKTSFVSANFDKRQTLVCAVAVGSSQSSCASSSTSRQKLLIHRVSEWPLYWRVVLTVSCPGGNHRLHIRCEWAYWPESFLEYWDHISKNVMWRLYSFLNIIFNTFFRGHFLFVKWKL